MNESTRIRVGDRVRIRTAYYNRHRYFDGREGEVTRVEGASTALPLYHVAVPGRGEIPTMSVALAEPEITVGDRVIIREGFTQGLTSSVVGRTGEVVRVEDYHGRTRYLVRSGDRLGTDYAARVEKLPADPVADGKSAAEIDAEVSELPLANRQAAQYAHDLLGDSADLDKLIGVAEFVMDRRSSGAVISGDIIVNVPSEVLSTKTTRPADRVLRDADGDEVKLSVVTSESFVSSGLVVRVQAGDEWNDSEAYLYGDNLDAAITFLTQARDHLRNA